MTEKLQKVLARAGVGSRRQVERWIAAGRVTVNGRPARLGDRVDTAARLAVDGRPVRGAPERPRVLLYHKPVGELCTRSDPLGRATVFRGLPRLKGGRWVSVGRLDLNTSGLLLFTNAGELANRLTHPRHRVRRVYMVRVLGEVTADTLARLRAGVVLEDGPARFLALQPAGGSGANRWYRVSLAEGRKREVRRLWEAAGHRVSRLIRVGYGPLALPRDLPPGAWREATAGEVEALLAAVGLGRRRRDGGVRHPARRRR